MQLFFVTSSNLYPFIWLYHVHSCVVVTGVFSKALQSFFTWIIAAIRIVKDWCKNSYTPIEEVSLYTDRWKCRKWQQVNRLNRKNTFGKITNGYDHQCQSIFVIVPSNTQNIQKLICFALTMSFSRKYFKFYSCSLVFSDLSQNLVTKRHTSGFILQNWFNDRNFLRNIPVYLKNNHYELKLNIKH